MKSMATRRQHLKVLRSASLAEASQRAYASDIRHYRMHQGRLPATPTQVALYIAQWSPVHAFATLTRRMAALDRWHRSQGIASPVKSIIVQEAIRGVRRIYGGPQRQVRAITAKDLSQLVKAAKRPSTFRKNDNQASSSTRILRDSALLLLGFSAALRRSELVALQISDLKVDKRGMTVHIRRSKTDPYGRGQSIQIPWGTRVALCPIRSVQAWIEHADLSSGLIFRSVDRYGNVGTAGLSPQSVALIVKRLAALAWGEKAAAEFSGHSLRAGFCTDAVQRGMSIFAISQMTRHRSVESLGRYVRAEP
ncbi:site-specific integrase [Comamonas sp.]|uniref:site-specific integrase n=1 Tax=Comamonas sp. TaxID=34028 RepID=UPI0028AC8D9B|nr:site-specific integrase [Comamonas sp.]